MISFGNAVAAALRSCGSFLGRDAGAGLRRGLSDYTGRFGADRLWDVFRYCSGGVRGTTQRATHASGSSAHRIHQAN
jgi:hypothetical protein